MARPDTPPSAPPPAPPAPPPAAPTAAPTADGLPPIVWIPLLVLFTAGLLAVFA